MVVGILSEAVCHLHLYFHLLCVHACLCVYLVFLVAESCRRDSSLENNFIIAILFCVWAFLRVVVVLIG